MAGVLDVGLLAFRTAVKAPSGLSAIVLSSTSIALSWSAPGGFTIVTYELERSLDGVTGWAQIYASSATSTTSGGLSAATAYSYRVRALDSQGNYSPYSAIVTATTLSVIVGVTYSPWLKTAMDQGTVGQPASLYFNNLAGRNTTMSSDIVGPFGETKVVKVTIAAGQNNFGGSLLNSGVALNPGDQMWWRLYHLFPLDWCAGGNGGGDYDGSLKWLRAEWANGTRTTFKIGGLSNNACALGAASPTMRGVASEIGTASNNYDLTPTVIPRAQWTALQIRQTLGQTAGTSSIDMWVDATHTGAVDIQGPLYPSTLQALLFIAFGDYWNGQSFQTTSHYVSNWISTKQIPNTLDSGGRPYISPTTRITDFP